MQVHCHHNNTQWSGFCLAALLLALISGVSVFAQAAVEPDAVAKKKIAVVSNSPQLEAVFTDGSILKLRLIDQQLKFQTSYGELVIPVTHIMRIEFATRLTAEMSKQIDLEIAKLGSPQFKVRDAATANLLSYREKAFPALMKAMTQNNVEVVNRAKQLVARIRKDLPPEMLEGRNNDVIHTADSKIAGRLVALSLKVQTHQFGEQLIKLPDLLSLREPGAGGLIPKNTLPDPGMLHAYQGQVNKVLFFRVTGGKPRIDRFGAGGVVWGTDTYTLDSTLALVAVHAGALKAGQSGVVKVTILGPQAAFKGSVKNGVRSNPYGTYPGSFKVEKVR